MSLDEVAWVAPRDGVRSLVPAVGALAFAPDESHLAWVDGLDLGAVHVTELTSSRTVLSLRGARAVALDWSAPDALRVLRRAGADATLHVHAVPDGGELARIALPKVGVWPVSIEAPVEGRVSYVGPTAWEPSLTAQPDLRAWLVRDDGTATRFDPYALLGARERSAAPRARCAMSPDGATLAVAFGPREGNGAVAFVDLASGVARRVALGDGGTPTHLRWVGPSRVFVARVDALSRTAMHTVDPSGPGELRGTLAANHALRPGCIDLHPDRHTLLLPTERRRFLTGTDARTLVEALALDGPTTTRAAFELSRARPPSGGACWDARGRLLTLTHPRLREAHLARRESLAGEPHVLLHLPLPGEQPEELAMTLSPRRATAAVTWFTSERGPAERARRLTLLTL